LDFGAEEDEDEQMMDHDHAREFSNPTIC